MRGHFLFAEFTYMTIGILGITGLTCKVNQGVSYLLVSLLDRELPPLAKNYVMRMLFLDQPLPQAAVALWVKKDSEK